MFARWEFPQRSPWLWFYVVCTPNVVCYVTDVVAVYKSVFSVPTAHIETRPLSNGNA